MRLCLLFVTLCVKYSWCIYNIDRHKGLPLVKAATDSAAIVIGNEHGDVTPSVIEVSNSNANGETGVVIMKAPQDDLHQHPVTIDDQTIDAFNNLPSKNISPNEVKEEHSAMAIFFEKMSMFQMIMQASLEAIINRVSNLESTITTKKEESNDSGIGRKNKNEISFETTERQWKNVKISRMPEDVETGNPPKPVSGPTDADCVDDPKNEDEEPPERFNVDEFIDESNLWKREAFIDTDEGNDAQKSGFLHKASVNDVDLHVSDRRKNDIGINLTEKGDTISSPSKNKKNNFKLNPHKRRMDERKISHSREKFANNYEGHAEESLPDSYQNDYVYENFLNDISDDQSQTSNVPFNPSFAPQKSSNFLEKEPMYQPPQTTNKFQPLNRTAFETDRSRENPRLEYQMMKLQRRSDHQIAPKGSDYDCLDDDGIDCPGMAVEAADEDDKARKLDQLTRKDNFQARTFSKEVFDIDVELINIERAEKKLEDLIQQTAMIGELQELLGILNNFKPGCPYNVPSVKVGERCYSMEFIHLSFNEARQFCKARGGTLAQEPLNGYIWSQITKAYPNHESMNMWIGAHDKRGEGRYHFFNGEEISSSDNRWDANSPSYSGSPNCLSVHGKNALTFKDHNCDKKQHFICDYPLYSFI